MEKNEIAEILFMIQGAYQSFQIGKGTPLAWYAVLEDVSVDAVRRAVALYLRENHEFWPSPGQIYQLSVDVIEGPKEQEITPHEAFELARSYASAIYCKSKVAEDSLRDKSEKAFRVARSIGFDRFYVATDENRAFLLKDFVQAWNAVTKRDREAKRQELIHSDVKALIGFTTKQISR